MNRALLLAAIVVTAGCGKEKGDDHVACEAPGGCSAVISTLGTEESIADLIPDGEGGVYAAFQGGGQFPSCGADVVCHGELWRVNADGDVDWKEKEGKSVSKPFLVPGGVGYRTGAGTLVVVDDDGDVRWRLATEDPLVVAAAHFGAMYVIAGGNLSRLDAETGEPQWARPVPEERPVAPVATGDGWIVTMGFSAPGELTARAFRFDGNGDPGWTLVMPAELSAPAIISYGHGLAPTLFVGDRLTMRGWDGVELWGHDGVEGFRFATPSITGGVFASGPYLDQVTEYRVNGTVAWSRPMPAAVTWVSPTPDGHVLVGQNDGVVKKLKGNLGSGADGGTTLWDYGGVDTVKPQSAPVYGANGNIVFWGANVASNSDTHVTTVTPFGQGLDRWDAGARVVSGALSSDDDVFVATTDGLLYLKAAASF